MRTVQRTHVSGERRLLHDETQTRVCRLDERTPLTDRGYEITALPRDPFRVHWFTGVSYLAADEVRGYVADSAGVDCAFTVLRFGRMGYRSAHELNGVPGLLVLSEPGEPDTMPPTCVVVPGEACEALGWDRLRALSSPFKPTRVDLAFDDFPFTPSEVKSMVVGGSVRTRAQRATLMYHEDFKDTTDDDLTPHHTVSLGSRGSSAFFRCYNSRGFDRGELELKGFRAVAAFDLLQAPLYLARDLAIGFLRAFIDFVDPSTDTNKSRQAPLPKWLFWYRSVQKAQVELPPRPVLTLRRAWDWVEKQAAPLAALLASADVTRFHRMLLHAENRWTDRHKLLLASSFSP